MVQPTRVLPEQNPQGWTRAYDALQKVLVSRGDTFGPDARFVPLEDASGAILPYFVRCIDGEKRRDYLLDENGYVERQQGAEAAVRYLRSVGVPHEPMSAELMARVVDYFGLVPFEWSPSARSSYPATYAIKQTESAAVLVIEKRMRPPLPANGAPGGGHVIPALRHLTVTVTAKTVTVVEAAAGQ